MSGSAGLIGLGSLAALLMIFVGVTGALRGNFASPAPVAARWRAMHMLAYPSWCAALIHGLYAGRAAKPFFTISYELCLLGVMAALALRAAPRPFKRKVADRIFAIVGSGDRFGRDDLDASRARNAEAAAAMAGFGPRSADRGAASGGLIPSQPSTSLYDTPPARTMPPSPATASPPPTGPSRPRPAPRDR